MASTYTSNLSLRKPENRDLETYNIWDQVVNGNMDLIDDVVGTRNYTEQNYITNSDKITASPLGGSIDKLDMKLKDVADLTPTANEKAALVGPPGHPPTGINQYATISYVTVATLINKKAILSPEYPGAVLTPFTLPAAANGYMISDYEIDPATNYGYTFYKWWSTAAAPGEDYKVLARWYVPEDFQGFSTVPNNALVVDINTYNSATEYVGGKIWRDGHYPTVSVTGMMVSIPNMTWMAFRTANAVLFYDASDPVLAAVVPGDVLTIMLELKSEGALVDGSTEWAKIGDITINYIGR